MQLKTPVRLTRHQAVEIRVGMSASGGDGCSIPALLNAASSRPKASTVASTAAFTSSLRRHVARERHALARRASIDLAHGLARRRPRRCRRQVTEAPARAKASAVARPMPLDGAGDESDLAVRSPAEGSVGIVVTADHSFHLHILARGDTVRLLRVL